jgi:hypothetical protein
VSLSQASRSTDDRIDSCITAEMIDHRSALIHVDLAGDDSRERAQARLEGIASQAEALCARNPHLEHIVALLHGCPLPESQVLRIAGRLALRLHQHLQTVRGSYVAVTALLNSPPLPPELLRERIVTLTHADPGLDPAVALSAHEIVGEDIGDVSASEIV